MTLPKKVNNAKEKLNSISPEIFQTSANIDNAREDLDKLLKKAEELTQRAQELNENVTLLREADAEGAYNITREAADRSAASKARTAKAVELIELAERQRDIASSRLEKNQMDFQKQFDENEAALKEIDRQVSSLEAFLPSLNKDVCGAEAAPCGELCGGPGNCGHCGGGGSCLDGSVTKAEQALMYANETSSKIDEKQKEAEGLISAIKKIFGEATRTKNKAAEGEEVAMTAARRANQVRNELEKVLNETKEFVKEERSNPEQIRVHAESVLKKKILLTPEEIQELADQIRDMLKNINNIDDILTETQGNKSIAADLQKEAEEASEKASLVRNATKAVSEALTKAEETQKAAQSAIEIANEQINQARQDITSVNEETKAAEDLVKNMETSLKNLENEMQEIRLKYLEVSKEAGRANQDAGEVMQKAGSAETELLSSEKDLSVAQSLLSEKQKGNEAKQVRAERLKERATKLLDKVQSQQRLIKELNNAILAADVRIDDYLNKIDNLNSRIANVSSGIDKKIDYHNTCDE